MTEIKCARTRRRLKPKVHVIVMRNGDKIYEYRRKRDLFVWRGQSIFAYLLSQGDKGTSTGTWRVVASENNTIPDMGDDSGDPVNNEFSPIIGSLVNVAYDFQPTVKPSGGYQTYADLIIDGTVTVTGSATLRKIGVIDDVATPNQNIVFEDSVIPVAVIANDTIYIRYTIQFG